MGYQSQGTGISKEGVEEIIQNERRKTRRWQIISIILGIIAVEEPVIFLFAR